MARRHFSPFIAPLALACTPSAPATAPQVVEARPEPAAPEREPEAESAPAATAAPPTPHVPTGDVVEVGDWGLTIELPPNARAEHDAAAARHRVTLSSLVSVSLNRVDAPAPGTLEEAEKAWPDHNARRLASGQTDQGVLYSVRELTVRVGFPGVPGQTVHTFKEVGRIYALLPLGSSKHVTCTGYVEHGVDSIQDRDISAVRDLCLSMRKR